jgi:hypothetical protein
MGKGGQLERRKSNPKNKVINLSRGQSVLPRGLAGCGAACAS